MRFGLRFYRVSVYYLIPDQMAISGVSVREERYEVQSTSPLQAKTQGRKKFEESPLKEHEISHVFSWPIRTPDEETEESGKEKTTDDEL